MKLNYKHTILTGLAFMTISAFWQMYDFHVTLILRDIFHIGDAAAGYVMSLDNVVALFLLPLFGKLSDKLSTPFGRRRPFIVIGTVISVAVMMMLPLTIHSGNFVLFMGVLGLLLICMATYRSPAVALMPDITPKPLRSRGNAVINLMGSVGGALYLVLNILIGPNVEHPETANYWPLFITVAAMMIAGTVGVTLTINEPRLVKKMRLDSAAMGIDPEEAKEIKGYVRSKLPRGVRRSMGFILTSILLWFMGYNAITTAFSKYVIRDGFGMTKDQASFILMVALIAATVAFIPIGLISSKIGRKKMIMGGVVLLTAVFGSAFFYTGFSPLMYVSFSLAGIAWAAINVNSLPMVLEMSKGADIGRFTGYYYTFSMAAQAVTPILSGYLLEHVSYATLFPYGAIFVALSFFTMLFVRHGDSRPDALKSKLEAIGAGD
jgi:Major Facilitator Superfamily.